MAPNWLPPLYPLSECGGNWGVYVNAVYAIFHADFILNTGLIFRGKPVRLKRYPVEYDKEATFWHVTSCGAVEEDRTPDLRRCERIRWLKAFLENVDDPSLKVWTEIVKNEPRIHIWCEDFDYLVVVADRGEYCLLWTAFCIEHSHQRRKYQKKWEIYR